jgi:hypothetical protein
VECQLRTQGGASGFDDVMPGQSVADPDARSLQHDEAKEVGVDSKRRGLVFALNRNWSEI